MKPVLLHIPTQILDVSVGGDEEELATTEALEKAREELAAEFAAREQELADHIQAEQAAMARSRSALAEAAGQIAELREELLRDIESRALDLGLAIARKVLMQELSGRTYDVTPIVEAALSQIPDRGEIKVYLNPEDLKRCLGEGASGGDSATAIHYLADGLVSPGSCRVESAEGCVESSVETSVEQIEQALRSGT